MSAREPADLLIEARWTLPIAPTNTAFAAHAVAVSAGRIVAVGPAAELRTRFAPREHLLRERHALLPGLVNAYTRAAHVLLQGLPVRGPRLRWLADTLLPVEGRCMSATFVRDGTQLAMAAMLRAGITCFASADLFPEEAARAAAAAHMRAAIGLPVADLASPWAEGANAHLARAERLWDEYRSDPRITLYFAPYAPADLTDATLGRVRRVADELDARIALHIAELTGPGAEATADEVRDGGARGTLAAARLPGLERLDRLGFLRPGFTAIGACAPDELELLARRGASLVTCPQAQLRLDAAGMTLALADRARAALGTDSPAASGSLDLLAEMRLAALLAGLPAGDALRMATLGGAEALGLAGQVGSIEPGKAADLICIDLGAGTARPEEAIVFAASRAEVTDVWTSGRAALRAGRLLVFEESELLGLAARWGERARLEAAA